MDLLHCPFCRSHNVGPIDGDERAGGAFLIVCDDCGAEGPTAISEESARELWNERAV
jgi:Lar family restriction alleviation protein